MKFDSTAVHIALTTYPLGEEEKHISHIKSIYTKFKGDRKITSSPDDVINEAYYEPYLYHIFGHYNLASISLIDSYKFAQKPFTNINHSNHSISYQIQTGSVLYYGDVGTSTKDDLDKLHLEYPFLQMTNFKLSNGLLIGNGANFQSKVIFKLYEILTSSNDCKFILLNSLNWSEVTLLLFSKEPQLLF